MSARVAALVLAAGASRRMRGPNKLLAALDGRPIVAHVAGAALASRADEVVVVTGRDAAEVERALAGGASARADRAPTFAHNPDADGGLSSSLRRGLAALGATTDGALVCLGDMPWLRAAHLDALIGAFAADRARPICVPVHDGRRGNPVLWPARHFAALSALEGDTGGRALLGALAAEVCAVPIADAAIHRDVDAPEDLPAQ